MAIVAVTFPNAGLASNLTRGGEDIVGTTDVWRYARPEECELLSLFAVGCFVVDVGDTVTQADKLGIKLATSRIVAIGI